MTTKLVIGVAVAAVAWLAMFAGSRKGFWTRAALGGATIAAYALAVDPAAIGRELARHNWAADLGVGLGSGVAFYAIFWVGEQLLVLLLPTLAVQVRELYEVRGEAGAGIMPIVLAIAAPGEELFFRGFLWHRAGVAVSLVVYAAVHIPERKLILVLAALVGGVYWGLLFAWTGGLLAPIVSHLVWIYLIVLWKPARPAGWVLRRARQPGAPL